MNNRLPATAFGWQELADAMRLELQEYGALHNLLEEQQRLIFQRDAVNLTEVNSQIDRQMDACGQLRGSREKRQAEAAAESGLEADATVTALIARMPTATQPLFEALIGEINEMIRKTQRKARQNQMLLARACEAMEQVLRTLQPANYTKTYTKRGGVTVRANSVGSSLQAAG